MAPGFEEEGQSWTDRPSPARQGAQPASSVDSPVCSSEEWQGNALTLERTDGWVWRGGERVQISKLGPLNPEEFGKN